MKNTKLCSMYPIRSANCATCWSDSCLQTVCSGEGMTVTCRSPCWMGSSFLKSLTEKSMVSRTTAPLKCSLNGYCLPEGTTCRQSSINAFILSHPNSFKAPVSKEFLCCWNQSTKSWPFTGHLRKCFLVCSTFTWLLWMYALTHWESFRNSSSIFCWVNRDSFKSITLLLLLKDVSHLSEGIGSAGDSDSGLKSTPSHNASLIVASVSEMSDNIFFKNSTWFSLACGDGKKRPALQHVCS